MRPLIGIVLFGLIYSGLVWTSENSQLHDHAEREKVEAQKAAEDEAARLRKAEELADQARQIAEEQAKKQREMSPENRERQEALIRERLSNLENMRETLGKKLGEDHPQIEAITREVDVLQEELREISLKEPGPQEVASEQELAFLRQQLAEQLKHRDQLAQTLALNHPSLLKAQDKAAALEKLLREKEGKQAQAIKHLRAAAEHLEQAGMPEMARDLRERANDLERELRGGQSGQADALKELQEQMRDMRQAIKKLDDQVAELREQLQKANE